MTSGLDAPLALSWSGGKDSCLALQALREDGRPPALLLTTIDEATQTVPHHGVALDLLERQADAVGLPLVTVAIPPAAANVTYEQRMRAAFATAPLSEVAGVAFGDLFLEDLRAYRETRMADAGLQAQFPLWGRDTARLARTFIDDGFRATLVSVDGDQLAHDVLGSAYSHELLGALPEGVDPCGEHGEFHTFVTGGPVFRTPLDVRPVAQRSDGRFAWLELAAG